MKKYQVTISLIRRYDEDGEPVCELKHFEVEASDETEAIAAAKKLEISNYSIYESYADEID